MEIETKEIQHIYGEEEMGTVNGSKGICENTEDKETRTQQQEHFHRKYRSTQLTLLSSSPLATSLSMQCLTRICDPLTKSVPNAFLAMYFFSQQNQQLFFLFLSLLIYYFPMTKNMRSHRCGYGFFFYLSGLISSLSLISSHSCWGKFSGLLA